MERRELFKIVGACLTVGRGALAQHSHEAQPAPDWDISAYQPRFFSVDQYRALGKLCDIMIPADEVSAGASQAGVPFYIDSVLFYAKLPEQQLWLSGLSQVEAHALTISGLPFLECTPAQQEQIVAAMAINEGHPKTDLQAFFEPLKHMTLTAYCASEEGMRKYLGYRGDTELTVFTGCNHPEHQS